MFCFALFVYSRKWIFIISKESNNQYMNQYSDDSFVKFEIERHKQTNKKSIILKILNMTWVNFDESSLKRWFILKEIPLF